MHVAIYARKSIYSDKSDSTKVQVKMCSEYALNHYPVTTITEYEDEGYTGANINRPDFNRLLQDVKDKKIDILICYKIDRISRNVMDFAEIFNLLQACNVEFVSVKEQIDTSTPLGRAMMYMCSVFSQMERETTAERVKDNMIELAISGFWPGGKPPLGCQIERIVVNGKKHSVLAANEENIPFLERIYDTFLLGYTLNGLETHFKKLGVTTINGYFLSASQIYHILTTPHYAAATPELYDYYKKKGCTMAVEKEKFTGEWGVIVYGRTSGGRVSPHVNTAPDKWIVSVGRHKPLMSSGKWLSVQEKFGINIIDKTRKHEIGLLKSIVRCKCGCLLRTKHKTDKIYNKIYESYFCYNREKRGASYCDLSMVNISTLDNIVLDVLKDIKIDKSLLQKYAAVNTSSDRNFRSKDSVRKEIASIEKKVLNLTKTLQDNESSTVAKYIIAEMEQLDKLIVGLNYEIREIDAYEKDQVSKAMDLDELYSQICTYINEFDTLDYNARVTFLSKIIKNCTWNGANLFVTF